MNPTPPEGVAMVTNDGTRLPCKVTYQGVTPQGLHAWIATPVEPRDGEVVGLVADTVPPHTVIGIRLDLTLDWST